MHHALSILEIVELICQQASDRGRDLSVLARTSIIFQNPALNVLWAEQSTILNLLRCMPNDLWDISRTDYNPYITHIRLRRVITSTDWERPLLYSHRVRTFYMRHTFSPESSDAFEALGLSLAGQYLFPSLQSFHSFPPPELFHHIRLFLTPRLNRLVLSSITSSIHLSILSNLSLNRPYLNDVEIYTQMPESLMVLAVSTFVRRLTGIRSLNVPRLDQAALAHLAQLPGLKSLWIQRPPPPVFSAAPSASSEWFPALVTISMPTMQCAAMLFTSSAILALTHLMVTGSAADPPMATFAGQFYAAMAAHCSHSSLQEMHIAGTYADLTTATAGEIESYSVGGDILQPLFAFANLRTVSLEHPVGFDLDNATVVQMARSWPRLEELSLRANLFSHIPSRVTLEGVSAFAEHCPSLHTLAIVFDATSGPKLRPTTTTRRAAPSRLRTFNVGLSPINNPARVAVFLSVIFPKLRWIETFYDELRERYEDEGAEEELFVDANVLELHNRWSAVADALQQD
ncbi:hypothetical protein DFH09DRAFT_993759 [Mycena vulgaris]|nr:hypothetical protein DFH09DRAFT_993759 [Mycena vulgaris]